MSLYIFVKADSDIFSKSDSERVTRGWHFLCYSQIPLYRHSMEFGVNTKNSKIWVASQHLCDDSRSSNKMAIDTSSNRLVLAHVHIPTGKNDHTCAMK